LTLHPDKTRVVNDREDGFDFLGFHHRRVRVRGCQSESRGVLRWPSRKACHRFREQVRQLVGPPGRLRREWGQRCRRLRAYLGGWSDYFQHGQSTRCFAKLERFVSERVARNLTRSQPTGKRRQRRHWWEYHDWLQHEQVLPRLTARRHDRPGRYRGRGKVRWRAV